MTVLLTQSIRSNGAVVPAGNLLTLDGSAEADLVTRGVATYVAGNPTVRPGNIERLVSGSWTPAPSLFRLRLTGTGTLVLDSRDVLGAVSSAVGTFTAAAATNQIEFPYLGDAAIELRATFPSTLTVEVL